MNTNTDKPFLPAVEPGSESYPVQTMSSREIADLTGKQHDNVMRDIRNMLKTLDGGGLLKTEDTPATLKFEGTYRNAQNGEIYPCFNLPKRECTILVSGYDVMMRAKIVDRWMELERGQRLMSPAEILIAQGTALLAVERQQATIAAKQEQHSHKIAETERRLNQIETATDYFTVIGYARWAKNMSVDLKTAAELGRHATRRANHLGVKVTKIPDPRFGAVSQYPKIVLDFVWDEVFTPVQ